MFLSIVSKSKIIIKQQYDNIQTFIESYRLDRKDIMTSFEEVHQHISVLKASIEQNTQLIYATNQKVEACEDLNEQICAAIDNLGQYQRRETLEFHSIPDQGTRYRREDTNEIVMHFCDYYLGMQVKRSDISVSHRQPIEADRKKYGDRYIPPIYCRFVNRKLAHEILRRRHMLKNVRSKRGDRFFVKETLTLQRRLIRDRAKTSLTTYKFQWVKNGVIFVKKNENARPIRVISEGTLDKLINEQNGTPSGQLTSNREAFAHAIKLQKSYDMKSPHDDATTEKFGNDVFRNLSTDFPRLPTFTSNNVFNRTNAS